MQKQKSFDRFAGWWKNFAALSATENVIKSVRMARPDINEAGMA
jgi:hypothetical protein